MNSALAPAVSALGARASAGDKVGSSERLEIDLMGHREGREHREMIARFLEQQTKWRSVPGLEPHPIRERRGLAWSFPPFDRRLGNGRHAQTLRARRQEVARQGGPIPLLKLFAGSLRPFAEEGFIFENEQIGGARAHAEEFYLHGRNGLVINNFADYELRGSKWRHQEDATPFCGQ